MLIENVSLFSQFAVILSFTRFQGVLKNVSNIIAWTSLDEQIHANAGIYIINKIKEEHPEYFTESMLLRIRSILATAMEKEERIDRKSTRLNSSHVSISYAVFCLKKKKNIIRKLYKDTM